ncbi:MAG: isochorismatase family protein [Verrucomicrobiota bacterium]
MNSQTILDALQSTYLPVAPVSYQLKPKTGLVIIDIVKGFAQVGAGPLAPSVENPQVTQMVAQTDQLAKEFITAKRPILAFLDTHQPGVPEPPYPPHCEIGTGHEHFVDELSWLDQEPSVQKIRKDCINGYIGAVGKDSQNAFTNWIQDNQIEHIVTVGICTDICVMDFVLTALSARNHGLLAKLQDIVVYEPGCATYDLSPQTATELGLPPNSTHPQSLTHHIGLYYMASRGALIAESLQY